MVYLKKIYSKPSGLFKEVEFKRGLNLILGIPKRKTKEEKISLNSIGKSTLISLIDFCLLSNFDKSHKLYGAKSFMDKYNIVLELEINTQTIRIERSTESSNKISIFEENGDSFESLDLETAKIILFEKLFEDSKYNGIQERTWLRSTIPIFLRDEKEGYSSPIKYISQSNEMSLNIFHLMLMGLDNSFSIENKKELELIKKKKEDYKEIEKILVEEYGDIGAINTKLAKLEKETESLNKLLKQFNLEESYKQKEEEANQLTNSIKSIILNNTILKSQLRNYQKSYKIKIDIDPSKIKKIYGELNSELGIKLSKTIEEAIEYKNDLLSSRKNFIKKKVLEIEEQIKSSNLEKTKLEKKQKEIIDFLDEKELFTDIRESFRALNEKEKEYGNLKGKIALLETVNQSLLELESSYSKLLEKINQFILSQQNKVGKLRTLYNEIYEKLYPKEGEGFFDLIFAKTKDSKLSIVASSRDSGGFGKNRGCILVYDLMLLFNIISENLKYPRFWIHDGIFYGVYKNQLLDTLKLIKEKEEESDNFQYIITLNLDEEGKTKKDMEALGIDMDSHKIADYSNITEEKIFGREFSK